MGKLRFFSISSLGKPLTSGHGCRATQTVDSVPRIAAPHNLVDHAVSPCTRSDRGSTYRTWNLPPRGPLYLHMHALPAYKTGTAPLVLPPYYRKCKVAHTSIGARLLIQLPPPTTRPRSMASSSVLLGGGAGAAAFTAAAAGKALPRPCFLAARPHTVSGGRLCLQTPPRATPVRALDVITTTLVVFVLFDVTYADCSLIHSCVRLTTPSRP